MKDKSIWIVIVSIGIIAAIVKVHSAQSRELLVDNSVKILYGRDNQSCETPIVISESQLREAALEGDTEKMRLLIAAGADINQRVTWASRGNKTVLMIAAEKGHNDMVEMLLAAGADIDVKDNALDPYDFSLDGDTAFMYAVSGGHYDTVKMFVERGVDINQQNRTNKTPIKYAATEGHIDIVKLLIAVGADVNLPIEASPLSMAVIENHKDVVETLIAAGADVNINSGEALRAACFYGNQEIVEILLQAGADVNLRSTTISNGEAIVETALGIAKKRGHDDIVSLLKAVGAVD